MGDHLSKETLHSFFDELDQMEKEAKVGRFLSFLQRARGPAKMMKPPGEGGWKELGSRILHPIEGLKKGWKGMANPRMSPQEIAETGFRIPFTKARTWQAGEHIGRFPVGFQRAWREGGVKGFAEEASRRGWTGRGRITKYIPWGQKSMLTGFGGLGAYETATAPEGQKLQTGLSQLGSTAGWALSGGLKFFPSVASFIAPEVAGSLVGGKLDRMIAAPKLRQLGLAPQQIERLNDEQIVQLLQLHRQYMRGGV